MHETPRRSASKYDFVKVKVWLGEKVSHYYVLSRFLISRMLTVTKIKHTKAVQIALELKKYLVDHNLLEVSQDKLEAVLFDIMLKAGFGPEYVMRYKMVTRFFQQRRPLIILLFGVPCTGKSTVAQQLASALNLPNVLQTDIIYELLRSSLRVGLEERPLWARGLGGSALLEAFKQECQTVRQGLDGDLVKCIRDGKSIIIEGSHLDPGLFLDEFGRYGVHTRLAMPSSSSCLPDHAHREQADLTASQFAGTSSWSVRPDSAECATDLATLSLASAPDIVQPSSFSQHQSAMQQGDSASSLVNALYGNRAHHAADSLSKAVKQSQWHASHAYATEQLAESVAQPEQLTTKRSQQASTAQHDALDFRDAQSSSRPVPAIPTSSSVERGAGLSQSQTHPAAETSTTAQHAGPGLHSHAQGSTQQGQEAGGPLFVPVVLSMEPRSHALLLEDWCMRQPVKRQQASVSACLGQFQELQQYLTSYAALHVPIVKSKLSEVTTAVDDLHEYLLKCIEVAMTSDAEPTF